MFVYAALSTAYRKVGVPKTARVPALSQKYKQMHPDAENLQLHISQCNISWLYERMRFVDAWTNAARRFSNNIRRIAHSVCTWMKLNYELLRSPIVACRENTTRTCNTALSMNTNKYKNVLPLRSVQDDFSNTDAHIRSHLPLPTPQRNQHKSKWRHTLAIIIYGSAHAPTTRTSIEWFWRAYMVAYSQAQRV